jgi:ABC-type multidrug transport system fused ATPase/permease subunit
VSEFGDVTPVRHGGLSRLPRYAHGLGRQILLLSIAAAAMAAASVAGWLVLRDAIDSGMSAGDETRLMADVAIYVAVNASAWILGRYTTYGLAQLGQHIVLGVREHLFSHLSRLSLRYFSRQRAGWIIARLTSDIDALSDVLSEGLATLVANGLTLVCAIIGLYILDWRLALAACVIVPPALLLTRWFQVKSQVAFTDVRNRIAAVTAHIAESVSGMAVVQAYNREQEFQRTFDELNGKNRRSNFAAQRLNSFFFPGIEFLGVIATGIAIYLGARLHDEGTMTVGTLIAFTGLLSLVFQPLQELSELYGQVQSAGAAMNKISIVLDTEVEIESKPDAIVAPRLEGTLDVNHVTFAYGTKPVLCDVDLHVPAGGCIALVGESGGGKSTLAKLIGRFYDPDEGTILVDGHDLRDLDLSAYRRQLGVVLQDPFLFAGTIADNVRFARPDASDDEVREVAEAVGLDRVASRLESGLMHHVREGGSGISAGERQLISIARALLADPRILILDEATSNIDRPTEIVIERALDRLLHRRTSLIIAHRLATIRRADEVLVVERGVIVQRGSERDLRAVDGPFRKLAEELAMPANARPRAL